MLFNNDKACGKEKKCQMLKIYHYLLKKVAYNKEIRSKITYIEEVRTIEYVRSRYINSAL